MRLLFYIVLVFALLQQCSHEAKERELQETIGKLTTQLQTCSAERKQR